MKSVSLSPSPLPALPALPAFHPSAAQRRLLDHIHETPSFQTVQQLCEGAQVPRRTYYAWCKNPGFRLWLATAWSARLLTDGVVLLNVARVQSTRSYGYWKALFDLTFDPKGLGFLQQWQQNLVAANNDAFPAADQTENTPEPDPEPTSGVQAPVESDQSLTDTSCSDTAIAASHNPPRRGPTRPLYPHHVSSHFLRSLDRRRRRTK